MERVARDLHLPLSSVLTMVGLADHDSFRAIPTGYGIATDEHRLADIAAVMRLSIEQVRVMHLSHYDQIALDLSDLDPSVPDSFRRLALREWGYFSSTHICPECVAENDSALLLRWRLPFSFACVKHGRILVDTCTNCRSRTGSGRRDGRAAPAFLTRVPNPGHCANPMPVGFAYAGRSAEPCGFSLAELGAERSGASERILNAQRHLDRILDRDAKETEESSAEPLAYLSNLRSIAALLLHVAEEEDLGLTDHGCRDAWKDHVGARDDVQARRAARQDGEAYSEGPTKQRYYLSAPTSAALLAATLPTSIAILAPGEPYDVAAALKRFVSRAREQSRTLVHRLDRTVRMSDELRAAWREAAYAEGTPSVRSRLREKVSPAFSFTANHVPQLFWADRFQHDFADFFPDSDPDYARRFCSIALVKLVARTTWNEAETSLGIPASRMANNLITKLTSAGTIADFDSRLLRFATELQATDNLIEYGERRRTFGGFELIAKSEWKAICESAGVGVGKGGRRRQASIWVWAELTGNDFRLHRLIVDPSGERNLDRELYRRFVLHQLDRLRPELDDYVGRTLSGSITLPEASAAA